MVRPGLPIVERSRWSSGRPRLSDNWLGLFQVFSRLALLIASAQVLGR
jgi:hypothetical protein